MEQRSIFFDEWIKSLREQYKYVVRNNDQVTLPSLTKVMHDVGFGDDELAQLRVQATMHVDDVGGDFVPDMNVLDTTPANAPHPAECTCAQCIPIDESKYDADGQPLTEIDPEQASHEVGHVFAVATPETIEAEPVDDIDDVTFEDSLAEDEIDDLDVSDEPEINFDVVDDIDDELENNTDIQDDEPEDDPDAPQQMSMF